MKKIFAFSAAMMLLAAPAADAQSFLGKLKDALGASMADQISAGLAEQAGVDITSLEESESLPQEGKAEVVRPDQQLQRRHVSSFGWDGKVTPSEAKFPIPLLGEFPAVPSAQELANPTEAGMIAYYNAIKRVTLRAEELNADTTCEDAFSEQWRKKQEAKLCDAFGLTMAEWEILNSDTATPEQKEAVEMKVQKAIFGDMDFEKSMADAEAQMKKYENMSEEDMQAAMMERSMAAMIAVYKEDPSETKYVTGMTPSELEAALKAETEYQMAQMKKGRYSEGDGPTAQKMKEYQKMMTSRDGSAYTKRSKALQDKVQAASMKAMSAMEGGAFSFAQNIRSSMANLESKTGLGDIQAAERKYMDASMPMMEALSAANDVDALFSAAERKKVEAIKAKIYATGDPSVYNPLYLQAIESIRTYRVRAAEVWRASLQNRVDKVKSLMPEFIKAQRAAVEQGILPECGLWRAPLNAVIELGDILEEAYSEFPCDYPHMYSEEVERELIIARGESLWWPEFYVVTNVAEVIAGKNLFKAVDTEDGVKIYQFGAGRWTALPEDFDETQLANAVEPASAVWTSSDGKREVVYNAEGHWLQLPEGDMVYPVALEKNGNTVVWAEQNSIFNDDGTTKVQIIKCTYKL